MGACAYLSGLRFGIFQGAIAFCESGFDLEVDQEVVRENDELLPGTIGVVIVCGDGIEAESGLEFPDGFLVHATACTVGQVGGDRKVTGDFAMMWIIPAAGTSDAFSSAQDGAVHVDRQFSGAQQVDLIGNNVGVEDFQGVETLVGKPA